MFKIWLKPEVSIKKKKKKGFPLFPKSDKIDIFHVNDFRKIVERSIKIYISIHRDFQYFENMK